VRSCEYGGGVVWCGVVWCGVVWCGVVWCGVVWCGVGPSMGHECCHCLEHCLRFVSCSFDIVAQLADGPTSCAGVPRIPSDIMARVPLIPRDPVMVTVKSLTDTHSINIMVIGAS
jgi:hypothetical protein